MALTITLDKPYALKLTTRALRFVEHRDQSGLLLGQMLIECMSAASAAWFLYACLLHNDDQFMAGRAPDLQVDDVCDLLDEHWFKKGKTLKDLVMAYFGQAVVEAGLFSPAPPGKASPETGPGSPGSGAADSAPSASVGGSSA